MYSPKKCIKGINNIIPKGIRIIIPKGIIPKGINIIIPIGIIMRENPFKYGVVVTGDDFVDREEEIESLHKELSSGKSIILYSQRRLGKTSLLMEFISQKKSKAQPIYIDLYGMTTKEDLARQMVNEVIKATYTRLEKIKEAARDFLSNLKPKLIVSTEGNVTLDFSLDKRFKEEELKEIFDFPEKVAQEKNKRMIMIFDEFQEIAMMDGLGIEKLMRSRFQHHKNVSYVFAGSKEHLLHQMFEEKSRAFFKFARPLSLGPIPKKDFSVFIFKKFKQTKGNIPREIIEKILAYTNGHPYYTQYLCHEIWFITKSPKDEKIIDEAILNIITQQSVAYEHIWDELRSRNQRALLVGVAYEGEPSYSPEFIEKYKLKSPSQVEKSLQLLIKKGILDEDNHIIDVFFKEWLIKNTSI